MEDGKKKATKMTRRAPNATTTTNSSCNFYGMSCHLSKMMSNNPQTVTLTKESSRVPYVRTSGFSHDPDLGTALGSGPQLALPSGEPSIHSSRNLLQTLNRLSFHGNVGTLRISPLAECPMSKVPQSTQRN
jgi:hypothetical protein